MDDDRQEMSFDDVIEEIYDFNFKPEEVGDEADHFDKNDRKYIVSEYHIFNGIYIICKWSFLKRNFKILVEIRF